MPAVVIAAAAANMAAANAAISANEARVAACQQTVSAYDASRADVSTAQNYAECVLFLHPTETASDVSLEKCMVIIAIILAVGCAAAGAILFDEDRLGRLLMGCMGLFAGLLIAYLLFIGVEGIRWVMS